MFLLFSSDAERLFKRNILDVLSLPTNHRITFRYQSKYVAPCIASLLSSEGAGNLLRRVGRQALIIYAQTPDGSHPTYQYCPVRFGRVTSLRVLGDIIFIELALHQCANLIGWKETAERTREFMAAVRTRAGAIDDKTRSGYFLDVIEDCDWGLWSDEETEGAVWQSVVDRLATMPSMANCVFYRVRGCFIPGRTSLLGMGVPERTIVPRETAGSLVFPVPMSAPVDLKLLFYRPSNAAPKTIRATFEVEADKSGFSEVPDTRVLLESRYDEITVRLATRRVFDNTLAPISIRLKDSATHDVLASEPLLLCVVRVPPHLLVLLTAFLFLAPVLLAVSAEDIAWVVSRFPELERALGFDTESKTTSMRLAVYAKVLGGLITAAAGFIVFRRFPVSK